MVANGRTLSTVVDHGRPGLTMVDHGRRWSTMVDHGRPWSTTVDHRRPRSTMVNHDRPWSTHVRLWSTMVDHGGSWSTMVDRGRPWSTVVDYRRPWSTVVAKRSGMNFEFQCLKLAIQTFWRGGETSEGWGDFGLGTPLDLQTLITLPRYSDLDLTRRAVGPFSTPQLNNDLPVVEAAPAHPRTFALIKA